MPLSLDNPTTVLDRYVRMNAARLESPLPLLWWSGVSTLAGVIGRGACTRILGPHGPPLFPNIYVVLVAEANSGKSLAVRTARECLDAAYVRQAADSTPPEAFLGWLSQATIKCADEGRDTGLFLALESMDSFFDRKISRNLKALLNAAYDCAPRYIRQTIKHNNQPVAKLCLNILAAGTPSHIGACFGADDWVDGLASRFLFVAGGEARVGGLLPWDDSEMAKYEESFRSIRSEVESLASPVEIPWAKDAWDAQVAWRARPPIKPSHPHASGYWARRHTSATKLATILAISARGCVEGTTITMEAWGEALDALVDLESGLPYCLSHTGANPYAAVQTKVLEWAAGVKREIREQEIRRHLWQFVPPQYVDSCIEQMVAAGFLIVVSGFSAVAPNRMLVHQSMQKRQSWSKVANIARIQETQGGKETPATPTTPSDSASTG